MPSDKQRIEFIERMLADSRQGGVNFEKVSEDLASNVGLPGNTVCMFTVVGQHQYGKTTREVIDKTMQLEAADKHKNGISTSL